MAFQMKTDIEGSFERSTSIVYLIFKIRSRSISNIIYFKDPVSSEWLVTSLLSTSLCMAVRRDMQLCSVILNLFLLPGTVLGHPRDIPGTLQGQSWDTPGTVLGHPRAVPLSVDCQGQLSFKLKGTSRRTRRLRGQERDAGKDTRIRPGEKNKIPK